MRQQIGPDDVARRDRTDLTSPRAPKPLALQTECQSARVPECLHRCNVAACSEPRSRPERSDPAFLPLRTRITTDLYDFVGFLSEIIRRRPKKTHEAPSNSENANPHQKRWQSVNKSPDGQKTTPRTPNTNHTTSRTDTVAATNNTDENHQFSENGLAGQWLTPSRSPRARAGGLGKNPGRRRGPLLTTRCPMLNRMVATSTTVVAVGQDVTPRGMVDLCRRRPRGQRPIISVLLHCHILPSLASYSAYMTPRLHGNGRIGCDGCDDDRMTACV